MTLLERIRPTKAKAKKDEEYEYKKVFNIGTGIINKHDEFIRKRKKPPSIF